MIRFEGTYTPDLVRRAAVAAVLARVRPWRWGVIYGMLAAGAGLLVASGAPGWMLAPVAVLAVLPGPVFWAAYRAQRAHMAAALARMGRPAATFTLTDAELAVDSGAGRFAVPWRSVAGIAEHPGFWLVSLGRDGSFTVLSAAAPDGALAFARERAAPSLSGRGPG